MRTIKLLISFDGTGFCGWQKQDNGASIQEELERTVSMICNRPTTVHGAGRTDAGVHAFGMTAHFRTHSRVSCSQLQKGLNSLLPRAVRILEAAIETDDFHARFSARAKTYRYSIFCGAVQCPTERLYCAHIPYSLSLAAMRDCLKVITGTHDFSSFETNGSRDKSQQGRGAVRTIFQALLTERKAYHYDFCFTGDGFLRHMVRNLTGTIIEVGRGKKTVEEFRTILKRRDRNEAGATASAHGLTLLKVHYQRDWS